MIEVVNFQPKYFDGLVDCYNIGFPFPERHSRYTLARLARIQRDTIILALDQGEVVGILIGQTSYREAWFTILAVKPVEVFDRRALLLARAGAERFVELGFNEAYFTTARKSLRRLAERIKATEIVWEPNYYFDGQGRWVVKADVASLPLLTKLSQPRH